MTTPLTFATVASGDSTQLRIATARPDGAARATVILLNGRTEFIEKYRDVIDQLVAAEFAVATLDWRGQGRSARACANPGKGHVGDYAEFLADLAALIGAAREAGLPAPFVMLAHSMGGHIGLRYLCAQPADIVAAAFSAPMWDLPMPWGARALAAALSNVAALVGAGCAYAPGTGDYKRDPFEGNPLTGDPARYARMQALVDADPRLGLGGPTLGWVKATLASITALRAETKARPPEVPVLVLSAGGDRIVSVPAHRAVAARLPNATVVDYPDAEHEILMERDDIHDDAMRRVVDFFAAAVGVGRAA
jgi:lysophospholipase